MIRKQVSRALYHISHRFIGLIPILDFTPRVFFDFVEPESEIKRATDFLPDGTSRTISLHLYTIRWAVTPALSCIILISNTSLCIHPNS